MQPNPTLKKLGFSPTDRVAIIHCDDIGLCQASVSAFADLWEFGLITAGATMLPCAWALEAAAFCQKTPQIDMGIHLTLTSEWPTYRWSPLSTRDPASGLLDAQGFFYHTSAQAQAHGDPQAVQRELQAQIDHAIANGITPTHIDTHMGTVAHPKFIPSYFQLALQYKLPPMFMRLDEQGWRNLGYDVATASLAAQLVNQLEASGIPLIDHLGGLRRLDWAKTYAERMAYAKQEFGQMPAGITHFIIHPATDTPELRAITPDWQCRVADYQIFMSQELRSHITSLGIHLIGYQALKNLMP